MNHTKLWKRLFVMHAALMLFAFMAVWGAQHYQLKHGLLSYMQQKNQHIAEGVAQHLAHAYAQHGDWGFLLRLQLLSDGAKVRQQKPAAVRDNMPSGPLRQRLRERVREAVTEAAPEITDGANPGDAMHSISAALDALQEHIAILDQDQQVLMGNPSPSKKAARAPVVVSGQTVGYVALEPLLQLRDGKVKQLITQQIKAMVCAALFAFLISLFIIYSYSKKLV